MCQPNMVMQLGEHEHSLRGAGAEVQDVRVPDHI